jgi:hypothetical protein
MLVDSVDCWQRLTRSSRATAGGGEICWTLNYHLSTLNFLRTTASAPARECSPLAKAFGVRFSACLGGEGSRTTKNDLHRKRCDVDQNRKVPREYQQWGSGARRLPRQPAVTGVLAGRGCRAASISGRDQLDRHENACSHWRPRLSRLPEGLRRWPNYDSWPAFRCPPPRQSVSIRDLSGTALNGISREHSACVLRRVKFEPSACSCKLNSSAIVSDRISFVIRRLVECT